MDCGTVIPRDRMTLPWTTEPERRWWQLPVFWTLALSLLLHALSLLLWTALPAFLAHPPDWMPRWLVDAARSVPALAQVPEPPKPKTPELPRPEEFEIPLSFIEVDPALAVAEKPKGAQFQSTANTLAQNEAAPKPELKQPFIAGNQEKYPKTFDTEKVKPKAEPKPKEAPEVELAEADRVRQEPKPVQPKQEPIPAQPPATQPKGELELAMVAKPGPPTPPRPVTPPPREAQAAQAPQEEQRPTRRRALKNLAQARQDKGIIVGEKMKQDGGVQRRGIASFNAERGPMGDYGSRMWAAVQERWFATLEAQKFAGEFRGKVIIDFKLHPDGAVTEVTVKNEGSDDAIYSMYCVASIQLSASFGLWSNEMKTTYGLKPIDCECVFWY